MARVLWTATHQLGGLFAGAPIFLEMKRRGHEVVVLSTAGAEGGLRDLGFDFRPNRQVGSYDWTRRDMVPVRLDDYSFENYRRLLIDPVPDQAADVGDLLEREAYDVVVSDGMTYGAGLAAERAGLPWACYVSFAFDESISFTPPQERAHRQMWDELRAGLGLATDRRPPEETPWLCFSPHLTLVLGLPDLAFRRAKLPSYVTRVGPMVWDPPTPFDAPPWFDTLGRDRPVIALTTSSAWVDEAGFVVKVAEGVADEDVDVVATVPAEHDLPPLPANVRVTRYLPHGLLIPRCHAVVCSASYGVATRAACAGLPLVLVPYGGDGYCVALAAAQAGIGIALDPAKLTSTGLRSALRAVLQKPEFSTAARRLAADAKRFDAAKTSADALETLL